jgi:ABC-type glycerol-3-phosphate transport system permease component
MITGHKWLVTAGALALIAGCGSSGSSAASGKSVTVVPVLVVAMFAQRRIVEGLALGAAR